MLDDECAKTHGNEPYLYYSSKAPHRKIWKHIMLLLNHKNYLDMLISSSCA